MQPRAVDGAEADRALTKKIDTLIEAVATVKDLVRGDSESKDEDEGSPGQMNSPGELDEDEDEDGDEDEVPESGGVLSSALVVLFFIIALGILVALVFRGAFVGVVSKLADPKVTESS